MYVYIDCTYVCTYIILNLYLQCNVRKLVGIENRDSVFCFLTYISSGTYRKSLRLSIFLSKIYCTHEILNGCFYRWHVDELKFISNKWLPVLFF